MKNRITKGIDFVGSKLHQLLGGAPVQQAAPNQATEEQVDAAMQAELAAQAEARAAREAQNAEGKQPNDPF